MPVSRMVTFPCVLCDGSEQLMLLGLDAWTRVNTCRVGFFPCGLPLNSSTQPLMMKAPLAFAVAIPLPTFAFLQAAIAPAIVWFESWLAEHFFASFGLIFQFLSRKIWVLS